MVYRAAVGGALIADPTWVEKVRTGDVSTLAGFDAAARAELA